METFVIPALDFIIDAGRWRCIVPWHLLQRINILEFNTDEIFNTTLVKKSLHNKVN